MNMDTNRIILHVDLNNFYASVECLYHPDLRGKPVAVGGDEKKRHGIILAKNERAKAFGVKTGEALWQARRKCPGLVLVPPHFDRYLKFSRLAREIYGSYTEQVESFGLDECWLDVTGSGALFGGGRRIADDIRARVKRELGVTVSVGVSFNKIFAKLGSDQKKPDGTTVITRDNYRTTVWPLPVSELLFVGPATTQKLERVGILTIGDLARADAARMGRMLGKNGVTLWRYANGLDTSPVARAGERPPIKSIGNSRTAARDLVTDRDVKIHLYVLCESVAERLREEGVVCQTVSVSIRDSGLYTYERQTRLAVPTASSEVLFAQAFGLYKACHPPGVPIRSMGVQASGLTADRYVQLSCLPEAARQQKREDIERVVDDIRRRFGHFAIQRGVLLSDTDLSGFDPKGDHVIHPEIFVR